MVFFAVYMAFIWSKIDSKKLLISLFSAQWILNISWNPTFFYYQNTILGLIIISALTCIVGFFLFNYAKLLKFRSALILPYLIWLLIATSLNAFIVLYN